MEYFTRIFVVEDSSFNEIWKEHQTRRVHGPNYRPCQCSSILIGQEYLARDIGRFSALETTRSGMEIVFTNPRENGISSLHRWYNESRKQVTQSSHSASALS